MSIKIPKIGGDKEAIINEAVYLFEGPIRNCLKFRDEYLLIFFYTCGISLLHLTGLLLMVYKLNCTSLFYSIFFVCLLSQAYYPLRFPESFSQATRRTKVTFYLKC